MREKRIKELLRELSAEYFGRHSGSKSLITVTNISVSKDLKKATIYISVLPKEYEEEALSFVKRNLSDFRKEITHKLTLKTIPYFDVEIDLGEKNRQRIDELSNEL